MEAVAAAAYAELPGWFELIVQVPEAIRVSVVPLMLHTELVVEVKLTGKPELDVAVKLGGLTPSVWLPSELNVIA